MPDLRPCRCCNGSGSEPEPAVPPEEPTGFEPGPGLSLIRARQQMIRAVLTVQLQTVNSAATAGTLAGSTGATQAYDEVSMAARRLVLAQNAWDDYLEAKRAEKVQPW